MDVMHMNPTNFFEFLVLKETGSCTIAYETVVQLLF